MYGAAGTPSRAMNRAKLKKFLIQLKDVGFNEIPRIDLKETSSVSVRVTADNSGVGRKAARL